MFSQLLWFFGIHGDSIVNGVMTPIFQVLQAENQAASLAGQVPPNIICQSFWDSYASIGIIGSIIAIVLIAKSKRYIEMKKIAAVPYIFNVGEPTLFGIPLMMNVTYFIPFILPNQKGHLSTREKKDIMPENNEGMYAVPQILTKNAEDFIQTAETLQEYGYNEVNLNLGCPSKTVVTKGRGAGFLDRPDELDKFLDEIFRKCDMKISIKTRLGMDDPEEFEDLLTIYNKYPLEELIVHARVQKDYYKNTPRLETFGEAVERAKSPVCYNGDIVTAEDCTRLQDMFPTLDCIMTGRGTLKNPALAREIRGGAPASKEEIRRFHDMMYNEYCEDLSGDRNILFRMKELWSYLAPMFTNSKKYAKKIKKAEKCVVYENTVRELFSCEQFKKGAEAKGHQVNMVQSLRRLYEKWRYLCIKR